jgi:16S rRNA (adenine1518-N6/adenine1519-N6)-dimethyltransferase
VQHVTRILVMVQREVAERFAARPGDSAYGAISVKASYWGTARIVGHVPASVFFPKPNVESALVEIVRRQPPDIDPVPLFTLVKKAFGQRRKMLRKSLSGIVTAEQFEAADVLETARPEELGVDAWVRLTAVTLAR